MEKNISIDFQTDFAHSYLKVRIVLESRFRSSLVEKIFSKAVLLFLQRNTNICFFFFFCWHSFKKRGAEILPALLKWRFTY